MSNLKNPKTHAFPVFSGDMIAPVIGKFFWSISLEQTLDLAMGKPDCNTKTSLKELLLNLIDECCTFILCNIPKQGIRSEEVDTILGNVLLTAFADTLQITGKVHSQSFDFFNELFLKYVKESLRSVCSVHDPETSVDRYISWSDAMDSILPHALRLIEELLVCRCKEHRQMEQKAVEDHQQRKNILEKLDSEVATDETEDSSPVSENEESDLKMVDAFVLEELSKTTSVNDLISYEREPDIKIVEEFISEEFSDLTKGTHLMLKEKESCLEMSDQHHLESPGNSLDDLPPTENQAAPLPNEQQKNKAAGVKMNKNLQIYCNRDSPPPEDEETTIPSAENVISEKSTHSKGRHLVDAQQESVVNTEVAEPLPVAEKEDQQSSILLLVNAVLIKAITKSKIACKYNHLQAIIHRLSEKISAEVKGEDLQDIQSSLNNLSKDILRAVSRKLGCSTKDVLALLGLNSSTIDEAFISICKEKMVKPAKKPSLFKRFWASISKTSQ